MNSGACNILAFFTSGPVSTSAIEYDIRCQERITDSALGIYLVLADKGQLMSELNWVIRVRQRVLVETASRSCKTSGNIDTPGEFQHQKPWTQVSACLCVFLYHSVPFRMHQWTSPSLSILPSLARAFQNPGAHLSKDQIVCPAGSNCGWAPLCISVHEW